MHLAVVLVESIRMGERLLFPGQQLGTVDDGAQQHLRVPWAG